jgi:cytochrome c-type biogenesis protein CcmH/NrfF
MKVERSYALQAVVSAVLLAALVGLLVGAGIGGGLERAAAFPDPAGGEAGFTVQLSEAGRRVASGLKCPCGCPDMLLACNCTKPRGAAEVKRLIIELLRSGRTEAEVRVELTNRYGAALQPRGR